MWRRIRQVVAAVTAQITAADRTFVAEYLTPGEQALFYGMNLPDQRHALNVAYTAITLLAAEQSVDRRLLLRCALLHDVGRMQGDASTADKVLTVIMHKCLPRYAKRWARLGRGGRLANVRHALYVYFHHPVRSAALLRAAGTEAAVTDIVARHHAAPQTDDPPELLLLRRADDLN